MRQGTRHVALGACLLIVAVGYGSTRAAAADDGWNPAAFGEESTLKFLTVGPEEGDHWTTVWLVILDDQVYIRLGTAAAGRMDRNTTAPLVKVRVADHEFARVRAEAAPDMAARVGTAMGEKYWTDLLIRHTPHPLTMRLVPSQD